MTTTTSNVVRRAVHALRLQPGDGEPAADSRLQQRLVDALLFTGLVILPLGLIALGMAMLGAPDYGKRIGRTTVALGVAGLAAATALVVGVPAMAAVGVFALIVFHLTLGWKTHRLAKAPHSRMLAGALRTAD